jgi:hypothetical protein
MGSTSQLSIRGRHVPALDGVRALAIIGVIAYHLGAGWASGGFLGVDLFFVLSGFLITSLLVEERVGSGSIRLGAFWARRARRLLPGLLLMLVVLGAFFTLFGPGPLVDLSQVRGDAIATVLYVANWHQLFAHQSYFDQFAAPSPLQHTWSLGLSSLPAGDAGGAPACAWQQGAPLPPPAGWRGVPATAPPPAGSTTAPTRERSTSSSVPSSPLPSQLVRSQVQKLAGRSLSPVRRHS